MAFNWTCPYCNRPQTAISDNTHETNDRILVGKNAEGQLSITSLSIACVNTECRKTQISVFIGSAKYDNGYNYKGTDFSAEMLYSQRVLPLGYSRPQPEFIPLPLREDYAEACLIRDLSAKASATLTRRCLQGMIRDFAGIARGTLDQEIKALRSAVEDGSADRSITIETVEAIDHVRGVGNIGAHMEKDIDLIIPVDPGEAQALIELVEMLFDEWYAARENRKQRLSKIAEIASGKKALKAEAATPQPACAEEKDIT